MKIPILAGVLVALSSLVDEGVTTMWSVFAAMVSGFVIARAVYWWIDRRRKHE